MQKKKTSAMALTTLLLAMSSIPVHAVENSTQTTKVVGTFIASLIDVQVPAVVNFIYNPNTETMTTGNITLTSQTNSPIYANLKEINVSDVSAWSPSLVAPDTFSVEQWRNLTKDQSKQQIALGLHALNEGDWLNDIDNEQIWSNETNNTKIGIIKNNGSVETQPTLVAGTSIPTEGLLTTNYIFEFGLEAGNRLLNEERIVPLIENHGNSDSEADESKTNEQLESAGSLINNKE